MKQMFMKALPAFFVMLCLAATTNAQNVLAGLTSNGGVAGKGTAFTIKTDGTGFTVVKPFEDWGKHPNGDLCRNSDGFFYGMTYSGGTYGSGTIFKVSAGGAVTILRHLNNVPDGGSPLGELIKGVDGNFYGVTSGGGTNTYGTVFKMTPAGVYTVLRHFNYATDGTNPKGHLVQGKDSAFYGITYGGGANGVGTIFKITSTGTFTVLRHLNKTTDGGQSYSSLLEGTDGNLYGATYSGGTNSYGTIFKITKAGVFTVLRHLSSTTDGAYPQGDLIQATDGAIYGSCYSGGSKGNGTIFKITTAGVFTVLRHLTSSTDGGNPFGNLYQHTDGALYGLNRTGGTSTSGTAYKITTGGTFTILHSFVPATEGSTPNGGFTRGSDGNLYAMTNTGGAYGFGTAFRMTTTGTVTVIAAFNGAKNGNTPMESLVKGKDSAYYGTASIGGAYGHGTIFKICAGVTTTLYSFNRNVTGGTPQGSLIQATDGNFYGTTSDGGNGGSGTIFRITPGGTFTVIKHFTAATDGGVPKGSLVQGKDSLLYGITTGGGTSAGGTIFKVSLSGSYTVLKHLAYATEGSSTEGGLVQANDGFFYGMTYNNAKLFKISSAGVFTIIRSFSSNNDGYYPLGSLVKHPNGNLYGMTSSGGSTAFAGTVFQLTTAGVFTVIKRFNATTEGKIPKGDLLVGADGALYGMTSAGGTYNAGTIFKVTTAGVFTILRQLNLTTDGGNPFGGLIIAPVNNLVATAQTVTTNEDIAKTITLSGTGGSPLAFNIVMAPLKGTVSTGTAASRVYTPSLNTNGVDSFAFNISIGCVASAPAYVKINVTAVADTPVLATIGNRSVKKDSTISFKATATDADGQTVTYSLISAPAGMTISSTSGTVTWKPTTTGSFTFKVRATDNGSPALYDEEQVTITVTATLAAKLNPAQDTEAINTFLKPATVTVYPNPVKDNATIVLPSITGEAAVTVYDIRGAVISRQVYKPLSKNTININTSLLQPGTYIISIRSVNESETVKIIKQ
ncbi:MAG: T9SS type A sorting domain-containing protein [Ferruginibacter sp.]